MSLRKEVKGFYSKANKDKVAEKVCFSPAKDKGKRSRIRNPKVKPKFASFCNAKLVIDKKGGDVYRLDSDNKSSSSLLATEMAMGWRPFFRRFRVNLEMERLWGAIANIATQRKVHVGPDSGQKGLEEVGGLE
ncbi:hypothetical protein LWI29_024790 [Acer saccharum]|uniref:Uncharacterized protein n=1 Tax=Acer saccharum TaxID=4024 RepID=A0AA39W0D0_ACESA|nr:hypothetical protein LWI29_024790 [Acer saccharum]